MTASVRVAWRVVPAGSPRRDTAWELLRELLPPGAQLDNTCPRCGAPHGPVRVIGEPLLASVSYGGPFAVVAVAGTPEYLALGVDAEPETDAVRDAAGLAGLLGGAATATVRDWTRVEAAAKADGRGLRIDPRDIAVTAHDDGWTARVPGSGTFEGWDAPAPPGLVISVAVRRTAPVAG